VDRLGVTWLTTAAGKLRPTACKH